MIRWRLRQRRWIVWCSTAKPAPARSSWPDAAAAAGALAYRLHHALGLVGGPDSFQEMLALHEAVAATSQETEACAWGAAVLSGLAGGHTEHARWLVGPLL